MLDLAQTLADLVAIPSVNPMGRDEREPPYLESRVGDYLQALFQRLGVAWFRQPVEPGRDNLLARVEGRGPSAGKLILLDVHQDTVPVDGMTVPPFAPTVRGGRMSGRGTCDVKGGMAAMLGAIARLAAERPADCPSVVLACTVNEEYGFSGAKGIVRLWDEGASPLLPRPPDAVIVAEPTDLQVVVAHKGMVRWRCHTAGRAAHSSAPERGENAIFAMVRVLAAFEQVQREVGQCGEHPLCGRPTLNVGTIAGGISVNTVPDRCSIEIDRRVLPGESPGEARRQIVERVAALVGDGVRVRHDEPRLSSAGLADTHNRMLAERLIAAARPIVGECRAVGVPYGTNASVYSAAGVPTVVFGPGSIAQAHTVDEWIALDQLPLASEAFLQICLAQF